LAFLVFDNGFRPDADLPTDAEGFELAVSDQIADGAGGNLPQISQGLRRVGVGHGLALFSASRPACQSTPTQNDSTDITTTSIAPMPSTAFKISAAKKMTAKVKNVLITQAPL